MTREELVLRRRQLAEAIAREWTSNDKYGTAALVAAGVFAIAGIVLLSKSKRRTAPLGQAKVVSEHVSPEGVRSKMYFDDKMPIQDRVKILQGLVEDSIKDPGMRELALKITSSCPARDGQCEARKIYDYMRRNIRYTGDIGAIQLRSGTVEGIDLFQSARRTIQFGGGDCDDHSVLGATLLALNGITPKFRVTAPRSAKGSDAWSHIYTLGGLPKNNPTKWVAIDSTLPGENFATEAPYSQKLDFPA